MIADQSRLYNLKFGSGKVGLNTLEVLGFQLTADTLKPLRTALEKIQATPSPRNKKELRSWLGRCNYYKSLVPKFAELAGPLNEQLGTGVFQWGEAEEASFQELKRKLIAESVVAPYVPGKPTRCYTDASDFGMGALLKQEGPDGLWRVVRYASKRFRGAQNKYSVTRKEALAVLLALKEFQHLLRPTDVIYVDHQPLVGWSKGAASQDVLLERWGLKFLESGLQLEWIQGFENGIADQASRNLSQSSLSEEEQILKHLRSEVEITDKQVLRRARRYKLDEDGQLIFKGKRVPLREDRLSWVKELHREMGHPTPTRLQGIIEAEYNWESLQADIIKVVEACDTCARGEVGPRNDPEVRTGKRNSWKVNDEWSADLLSDLAETPRGFTQLLVLVEAVSGFVEVVPLKRRTAAEVSRAVYEHWCRFGIPRRLRVDQGSEFEKELKELSVRLGVQLKLISSHRPQSNGQVERVNRDIVDMLTRAAAEEDWDIEIFSVLRSLRMGVSRRHGRSPHEVMFGEAPRVPFIKPEEQRILDEGLAEFNEEMWRRRQDLAVDVQEKLHRYEAGTAEIKEGDLVWVTNFNRKKFEPRWVGPSVVVERRALSVKVKAENGRERVINLSNVKPYKSNTVGGAVVEP